MREGRGGERGEGEGREGEGRGRGEEKGVEGNNYVGRQTERVKPGTG